MSSRILQPFTQTSILTRHMKRYGAPHSQLVRMETKAKQFNINVMLITAMLATKERELEN